MKGAIMLARSIRLGAALAAIGLAALALPAPGFAAEDFAAGEGGAAVATIRGSMPSHGNPNEDHRYAPSSLGS